MMGHIRDQILEALNSTNKYARELSSEEERSIMFRLRDSFSEWLDSRAIWENLKDAVSVRESTAWIWIKDFIGSNQVIMLLTEYENDQVAFEFERGSDIVDVIGETTNFEFYLTDKDINYLLCFNHHDYLIASGTAITWLKSRIDDQASIESC